MNWKMLARAIRFAWKNPDRLGFEDLVGMPHEEDAKQMIECFEACEEAGIKDPSVVKELVEFVRQSTGPVGAFSRDPGEHARNCLEVSMARARALLKKIEGDPQ